MRRLGSCVTIAALAASLVAVIAGPASGQTANTAAFCAARIEGNDAETKAENLATMNKAIAVAPTAVASLITTIRDAYKKKGDKLFDSKSGTALLQQLDAWVYDNCGAKVPVTATDYQFTGIPSTLPVGITTFKMTNAAAQEDHMMAVFKEKPAAQGQDLNQLLSLPEKKYGKYFEETGSAFTRATPGDVGYAPINLTPGTYAYACFFPMEGKKNGQPHYMLGMKGTFTVQ
jgi:hypothetical protein